jgi:hypothetical protein
MTIGLISSCHFSPPLKSTSKNIVIQANVSKYFHQQLNGTLFSLKDEMDIVYSNYNQNNIMPEGYSATATLTGKGNFKWALYTDMALIIYPPFGRAVILHPGDSLHISYLYDYPVYTGKNNQSLDMLTSLMKAEESILRPTKKNSYNVHSIEDYMEWNSYLDQKLALQVPILNKYKDEIPSGEYTQYATELFGKIEGDRLTAFSAFSDSVRVGRTKYTLSDLCALWDSTQNKPSRQWLQAQSTYTGSMSVLSAYNRMDAFRRLNFDFHNDSITSKELRACLYYNTAKQKYKGQLKEKLLVQILDEQTIQGLGIDNKVAQILLKDYYNQPDFPEYKTYVKDLENKAVKKVANPN